MPDLKTVPYFPDPHIYSTEYLDFLKDLMIAFQVTLEKNENNDIVTFKLTGEQVYAITASLVKAVFEETYSYRNIVNPSAMFKDLRTRKNLYITSGCDFDVYRTLKDQSGCQSDWIEHGYYISEDSEDVNEHDNDLFDDLFDDVDNDGNYVDDNYYDGELDDGNLPF